MSKSKPIDSPDAGTDQAFHTTHWSVVLQAGDSQRPAADAALEKLCRAYWYPLYAYVRRQGNSAEDSQDMVQGFFEQALAKKYLKDADRRRGKFRSFLLSSLKHYMANQWRRQQQQKRGGGAKLLSLDQEIAERRHRHEPVDSDDPEKVFERRWAHEVFDRVGAELQREFERQGKADHFARLKAFLMREPDAGSYSQAAADLNLSESAVKSAIFRLRQRFGALFRLEISHTVASAREIDEEIQHLIRTLG